MDQKVVELFSDKKILLRNLQHVELGKITKIRTLDCYFGINLKSFYQIVFIRNAKSRLIKKDAINLNQIVAILEQNFDTAIKKRTLFYSSEICSKAKNELKNTGWTCYDFV